MDEAVELGRRAIYHATFRDAVSGGTVSGGFPHFMTPPPREEEEYVVILVLQGTAINVETR